MRPSARGQDVHREGHRRPRVGTRSLGRRAAPGSGRADLRGCERPPGADPVRQKREGPSSDRSPASYYLPFAEPESPLGAGTVALHVADGSEIVSERAGGPALQVLAGGARFGSCPARVGATTLDAGWLPILETRYAGYTQESFAARIPETDSLVSFVRVSGPGEIQLTPTVSRPAPRR